MMLFFKENQWKKVLVIAAICSICIDEAFNRHFDGMIAFSIKNGTIVTELSIRLIRHKTVCFLYANMTFDGELNIHGILVPPVIIS
jgi:hypothetical protein